MQFKSSVAALIAVYAALSVAHPLRSNSTISKRGPGNKRGIAADWVSPKGAVQNFRGPKFYTHYNWSPYRFDDLPPDVDFWPMLHGEHTLEKGEWAHVTAGYATTAMGLNEVNQPGQALMGVDRGIQIWREHLGPLKAQGYRLISHSTNQNEDGFQWHNDFRSQCPDCESQIDLYSVHWYGTDAGQFKDYMVRFHDTFGKPLVVTEFAYTDWQSQPNPDDVKNFMTDVMYWMDGQDWIDGYFWFGMWDQMPGGVPWADSLVNGDATPKDLGYHYMNV